jgi:hypothetical protein
MNLVSLGQQFKGRKFGELVLRHVKAQDLQTVIAAFRGTIEKLPNGAAPEVESWIDEIAPLGKNPTFWQRDCGEALLEICGRARKKLAGCGVVSATDEDLLSMFQIIVLNFAYGAHKDSGSKAFIQKSIGIGFLRRAFS